MQAMNYFKGKPQINPTPTKGDGQSPLTSHEFFQPGNLFPKGTKFVIFMFKYPIFKRNYQIFHF